MNTKSSANAVELIKSALKVLFLHGFRWLVPLLPHRLMLKLADLTGRLDHRGEKAAITTRAVARMLGPGVDPAAIDLIVLDSMREFHKDLFEIWRFPRLTARRLEEMAWLEGHHHLDAALAQGKGAIVGVTHFGSFKILIATLGYAGYRVNQVAVNPLDFIRPDDTSVNNIIMRIEHACEQSLPARFIYLGAFAREIYRALDRNEVVIMSLDGVERRKEVPIKLINAQVSLDTAPLLMATRRGVPFLPCFPLRQPDGRHRVVIHPPLLSHPGLKPEQEAAAMAQDYARIMEAYVREHPSHYARSLYVFATRWKNSLGHPA